MDLWGLSRTYTSRFIDHGQSHSIRNQSDCALNIASMTMEYELKLSLCLDLIEKLTILFTWRG
uniref:Uncharacterized protein n=1 Tax=Romanomermis culicivorax TaxID=13658 RepID=A0A915IGJ0_ROMCU